MSVDKALEALKDFDGDNRKDFDKLLDFDFHGVNTAAFLGRGNLEADYNKGKEYYDKSRKIGKTLGLAMCYGGNHFTVKRAYPDYSDDKCKSIVANFFSDFKTLATYLKKIISFMRSNGYIKTLIGRRIYIDGYDTNPSDRDSWLRANRANNNACNYPIQGSGAEVVRLIIRGIQSYLEENNMSQVAGNNCTKSYIKRIVSFSEITPELVSTLDSCSDGNTLVIIRQGNTVVKEWDKLISFSPSKFTSFQYDIEF